MTDKYKCVCGQHEFSGPICDHCGVLYEEIYGELCKGVDKANKYIEKFGAWAGYPEDLTIERVEQ